MSSKRWTTVVSLQAQARGPQDSNGRAILGKSELAVTGVGLASLGVGCEQFDVVGITLLKPGTTPREYARDQAF